MSGIVSMLWNFSKFQPHKATEIFRKEAAAALFLVAEIIMGQAKVLCPVDTGTLRNSGYVKPPVIEGNSITVVLGFGGAAKEYAIYVHENLNAVHPVGQAKFLSTPLNDALPNVASDVRNFVKAKLG